MMEQIKNMKLREDFILIISHEASSGLSHLKNTSTQIHNLMFGLSILNWHLFQWLKTNSEMLGNMTEEFNRGQEQLRCVTFMRMRSDLQNMQ